MKENVTFRLDELNYKRAENFFKNYQFETTIGDMEERYYLGTKGNPQKCRFCKKEHPEVTFENDAHVIPQFMGNKNLLSVFECDACNALFSRYERSLAAFFGITRTFAQIKGQGDKVPRWEDQDNGLKVYLDDKAIKMEMHNEGDADPITYNEEQKSIKIVTKRGNYIPIHIIKSIIKMGLCMLPDEEMGDHEATRKFIAGTESDKKIAGQSYLRLLGYFIPGPPIYRKPFVQLYKLKEEKKELILPTRQIVVWYSNYCFQLVLPYPEKDRRLNGQRLDLPIFPLLLDYPSIAQFGEYETLSFDFTSDQRVKDQQHEVSLSYENIVYLEGNNPT